MDFTITVPLDCDEASLTAVCALTGYTGSPSDDAARTAHVEQWLLTQVITLVRRYQITAAEKTARQDTVVAIDTAFGV